MTTTDNRVQLERKGPLAVIRLNRPEARNALSPAMVDELGNAIKSCRGGDTRGRPAHGHGRRILSRRGRS